MQWPYYPKTGLAISGSGWVDTGIRKYHAGEPVSGNPNSGLHSAEVRGLEFVQQSRFVLRATPTWTIHDQFFVQGQVELVAAQLAVGSSTNFAWSADDAWIRFGWWNKFDVLVGRFLPWEVYHYGMGLDLYTLERQGANDAGTNGTAIPAIYGLTTMYQRQDATGQGAIHIYPSDFFRFEAAFQYGSALGNNVAGIRPVGIADIPAGPAVIRLKAGAEFVDTHDQAGGKYAKIQNGYGGALQVILDPYLEFGANMAWSWTDERQATGEIKAPSRFQTYSAGGFANARIWRDVLIGGGINYTYWVDSFYDPNLHREDSANQLQPYGAVQYTLWDHLLIKGVFAYAKGESNSIPKQGVVYDSEMWSFRLRLEYLL